MKFLLESILYILSRMVIARQKPRIVAITGSVGKTSTKEAIYAVMKDKFHARRGFLNFNNEIGVPLTILGINHHGKNIFGWLKSFAQVLRFVIWKTKKYPELLVLEMGADHPRDISYLTRLAPPYVGVLTAIGEIPVHVEFFSGPQALAEEKSKIIRALPREGFAIINIDDAALAGMVSRTHAHVITFGFDEHASVRISDVELSTDTHRTTGDEIPEGISFTLTHGTESVQAKIKNAFGKPQAYAGAAAAAVGIGLGMTLPEIAKELENYEPPAGRLRLIKGIKGSYILDDTYNSSPEALHAALDTLRDLPGKRRIAVVGDMLELGKFSEEAHRAAGDHIASLADVLITVGPRMKFAAEEAGRGLENRRSIHAENILSFDMSADAGKALDPLLQEGDLILVKGSQGMRMERVVEEIMAEPMRARELLVRQSEYWKRKP